MKRYRKPYRIKPKKSILKNRFFWITFLFFLVGGAIFYFFFFSSFFEIKEIKISGNEEIKKEQIEAVVQKSILNDFMFFQNKNINLANLEKIKKNILSNFLKIKNVFLKKDLPNILEIKVEERKAIAIFKQNDNYFLTDKEGVIFEKIELGNEKFDQLSVIENLLLKEEIKLGEKIANEQIISKTIDILEKIKNDLKIIVKEIKIVSEERLNLKTEQAWEVYFNLAGDIDWQMTKLKIVLEKRIPEEKRVNLQYIDLRFERVYIFPENYNE